MRRFFAARGSKIDLEFGDPVVVVFGIDQHLLNAPGLFVLAGNDVGVADVAVAVSFAGSVTVAVGIQPSVGVLVGRLVAVGVASVGMPTVGEISEAGVAVSAGMGVVSVETGVAVAVPPTGRVTVVVGVQTSVGVSVGRLVDVGGKLDASRVGAGGGATDTLTLLMASM